MLNKKAATSIHWIMLTISGIASILIIIFGTSINPSVPQVGEFPLDLLESLEKTANNFPLIDGIMKLLIIQSVKDFNEQDILKLASYCGSYLDYPILNDKNFNICIKEEFDPENEFKTIFDKNFNKIKLIKFDNLDFSNINYEFSLKENFEGKTNDKMEVINREEGKHNIKISVDPSFSIPTNYDFNEFKDLILSIQDLLEKCKDDENPDICIKNNFEVEGLELLKKCESEEKETFYKVVEYIESCAYSKDKACICTKNYPSGNRSYKITQKDKNVVISSLKNEKLEITIENVDISNDNPNFELGGSYVHKDDEGKVIIQSFFGENKCTPQPKSKFRFCVESKKNKFYAYDEDDGKVALRDVVYKFALDFGEQELIQKSITIEKVTITEQIKELFKDKRIIIAEECQKNRQGIFESQQEVFDLANELGNLISETETQVIVPIGESQCDEINDEESFKQKYTSSEKSNILIVLNAGSFDKGEVAYTQNNEISNTFSEFILNELFLTKDFSENLNPSSKNFLSITDLSTEIVFTTEKLQEQNNYADAVFAGIVNYLEKIESPEIIFEYFDVKNPSGLKYGLVDLGWVWEIAKKENVNYYLLSSILRTESNICTLDLGKPFDYVKESKDSKGNIKKNSKGNPLFAHKAHGCGQHFPDATTSIYGNLLERFPDFLKYENLLEKYPKFLENKNIVEDHPEFEKQWTQGRKPPYIIYQYVFTSNDETSIKAQITATALYLKWCKDTLESQNKPTDTKTVIQCYHDGAGSINPDGSSKLIKAGHEGATNYYPKVASYYEEFIIGIA